MPAEKRQAIINAAMQEFTANGYAKASTNAIVHTAGIAKGLLFHYFHSKQQLYLALYDYAIQTSLDDLYARLNLAERDLFVRLRQVQAIKLELLAANPHLFGFIQSAYLEQDATVRVEIHSRDRKLLAEQLAHIYGNLDYGKFKDGIEPGQGLKIVLWTIEGYTNELLARSAGDKQPINYDAAFAEMDSYLTLLQMCLYR